MKRKVRSFLKARLEEVERQLAAVRLAKRSVHPLNRGSSGSLGYHERQLRKTRDIILDRLGGEGAD